MKYNRGFIRIVPLLVLVGIIIVGAVYFIFTGKSSVSENNINDTQDSSLVIEQNQDTQKAPSTSPVAPASRAANSFFVVDSNSGINVSNPSFAVNGNTYSSINTFLAYIQTLPAGLYNVDVSAPGYKTMSGVRISVPGNLTGLVINLEPTVWVHNCPRESVDGNNFILCGYVADEDRNALSGVQVGSSAFGGTLVVGAVTGSDGYYEVEFSPLQNNDCGDQITVTYSTQGYKTLNYVLDGPYIYKGGGMSTQLTLNSGSGTEQKIDKHGICQ